MNIVKPYAKIWNRPIFNEGWGIDLLRNIEYIGRVSHRSEESQTADSWQRFIKAVVIDKGDWSIVEHASVTVDFLVDRGITHEIVRHRLASFTQESTRFVNYEKKMPASFVRPHFKSQEAENAWNMAIGEAEIAYKAMIAAGEAPQIARSVFPNGLASRIIMTCNLRNWRHFLLMRTTREAHPQMREVTIPLLAEFQGAIPLLFDDVSPMDRQAEAIAKVR